MKLGSLFDGAGTCPYAASLCGIKPVWASEIEPFPIAVSSSNFPSMIHLGDITGVHGDQIEPVDIITFGSPCQDLSQAGKRAGLDGSRSGLFMEAIRIFKEMRSATNGRYPQIVIWENVPGAFSSNKGEDFRTVLQELCGIKDPSLSVPGPPSRGGRIRWPNSGEIMADGFSIAWRVLDARGWGVPQRRRRIFLVLDLDGQSAGEISFKRPGLRRNFKALRKEGKTPSSSVEGSSGEASGSVPYTLKIRSGSVREGPGHRVGGGDIPDSGSQYVGDRTDSVLPDAFAIENHPQDCRVKLSEDGTVQTLAARMGTGGGTRLLSSSPVPAGAVRELCPGRSERHSGDTQDLPDHEHRGPTFTYRRQKFGVFLKDQTAGTLRTMEGRDPSMVILETEGGI